MSVDYIGLERADNFVDDLLEKGRVANTPHNELIGYNVLGGTNSRKNWILALTPQLTSERCGFVITNGQYTNTHAVVSVIYNGTTYYRLFSPNENPATLRTFTALAELTAALPKSRTRCDAYEYHPRAVPATLA